LSFEYTRSNILRGFLIYTIGDTTAAILQHQFSISRMLGIMLIGSTIYAFEIPNFFKWIDGKLSKKAGLLNSIQRTGFSMLYFSPLWVARHLLFIKFFSGQWDQISLDLIRIAAVSFAFNLPVSFTANFLIQNKVPLRSRFMASAIFSAFMAVYYALAAGWFK
jgi:hypothetical protein